MQNGDVTHLAEREQVIIMLITHRLLSIYAYNHYFYILTQPAKRRIFNVLANLRHTTICHAYSETSLC
jgi:hypothetical protein